MLGPFLLGLNTQVAQLVILREALILSSGSETSLGLCLGAWALLNGLGAFVGVLCRRGGLDVGRLFVPLLLILPPILAASLHLARVSRSFTEVSGAEHLPASTFILLAALAVGPVTLLDGFLFVCGLQRFFAGRSRNRDSGRQDAGGRGAAAMYGRESAGSLVGGVLFSFVLVFYLDPFGIAGLLLLLNGVGLIAIPRPKRDWRAPFKRVLLAVLILTGLIGLAKGPVLNRASEEARWRILQTGMELVETRESPYQNLALLKYHGESTVFGNGGVILNLMPQETGYQDYDRAVLPNFAMLQHPAPRDVLLVGGGLKGYAADMLSHSPERVDWVEYDGALVDMVMTSLPKKERPAVGLRHRLTDGRYFVKSAEPASYDLIVLDVPDPANAAANRYYTREFFEHCRSALRPDGVLVFTITCQANFIGREMMERNASILAALGNAFEQYIITPGELAFVAAGGQDAALTASAEELVARYDARGVETPRFNALHFYNVLEEDDVEWVNKFFAESLASEEITENTDNRPAAYFKHHVFWRHEMHSGGEDDEESGPGLIETWLSGTGGQAPVLILAPAIFAALGLLFLCGALLAPRGDPGKSKHSGDAMARGLFFTTAATVGFSGIVLEMGLLLSYQSVAGHLYGRMGVIIAAYMAGLALGSLLPCDRRSTATPFVLSTIGTFAGTAAALNLPAMSGALGGADAALLAYGVVTAVLGASGGLAFRGVAVALERDGRSPGGTIYAQDILGTCLGGVLAGSVLVPFIGIAGAFVVAGGLNLMLPAFAIAALVQRGAERSHQ